jgi:hypothetical protein
VHIQAASASSLKSATDFNAELQRARPWPYDHGVHIDPDLWATLGEEWENKQAHTQQAFFNQMDALSVQLATATATDIFDWL